MRLQLETLTPVHIGSGEEISPLEYLVEDRWNRIDMNALFADPDFQPVMEKFVSSASSERYIGDLLPKDLLKRHILYTLPIKGKAKDYLQTNRVKAFTKTGGRVYIPGSSLKGSILSALLWAVLKEARDRRRDEIEGLITRGRYQNLQDLTFALLCGTSPKEGEQII